MGHVETSVPGGSMPWLFLGSPDWQSLELVVFGFRTKIPRPQREQFQMFESANWCTTIS